MRDLQRQDRANTSIRLAREALGDWASWRSKLADWSTRGYPAGSDGPSGRTGHGDPTPSAASHRDPIAAALDEADGLERRIAADVVRLSRLRAWARNVAPAPPEETWPVVCETCGEAVEWDRQNHMRNGDCNRCVTWFKRHNLKWPKRHLTPEEARQLAG